MRKILFAATFVFLLAPVTDIIAQETIEGKGDVVSRDITIASFELLEVSGVFDLQLLQGDKESVRIVTNENLHEYITVASEGNKLVIEMKKGLKKIKSKNGIKVYVSFKELKEIDLSTVGNVSSEDQLEFDELNLKNKSVGNLNLKLVAATLEFDNMSVGNVEINGKAEKAVFKNSSVGNLRAGNFVVQDMDIENNGIGNTIVNAVKNLKVKDNFLSKVKNRGAAEVRRMNKVRV